MKAVPARWAPSRLVAVPVDSDTTSMLWSIPRPRAGHHQDGRPAGSRSRRRTGRAAAPASHRRARCHTRRLELFIERWPSWCRPKLRAAPLGGHGLELRGGQSRHPFRRPRWPCRQGRRRSVRSLGRDRDRVNLPKVKPVAVVPSGVSSSSRRVALRGEVRHPDGRLEARHGHALVDATRVDDCHRSAHRRPAASRSCDSTSTIFDQAPFCPSHEQRAVGAGVRRPSQR